MQMIQENWWLVLVVAIAILAILFLLLRPRQRVTLTDNTPVRPHMTAKEPADSTPAAGRGIVGEVAAAQADVAGDVLGAPVHRKLDNMDGHGDDLSVLKGVGPKFADALKAIGFARYAQIAALSPNEVERLDRQLGAFRGRITRDRIVEQAEYLARNDIDGFEQKFGKL